MKYLSVILTTLGLALLFLTWSQSRKLSAPVKSIGDYELVSVGKADSNGNRTHVFKSLSQKTPIQESYSFESDGYEYLGHKPRFSEDEDLVHKFSKK